MLDETDVVVEDGTLKIMPKKRKGIRWSWSNRGKAVFTVNAAALHGAAIAGSGGINVDKVAGDFEGDVAGSGDLKLASVAGGKIKLAIAGSGDVSAAGKADSVDLSIAGSGDIDAGGPCGASRRHLDRRIGQYRRQRQRGRGRFDHGLGRRRSDRRRQVHRVQAWIGQRPLQLMIVRLLTM